MLKSLTQKTQQLFDTPFVLKYLVRFFVLYFLLQCFHGVWDGIIDPRGWVYSAFLDHYLNYFRLIRFFVLEGARLLAQTAGVESFRSADDTLTLVNGRDSLMMARPCYGLQLISVWTAFVLADSTGWRTRLRWTVLGLAALQVINALRVFLLLVAIERKWQIIFVDPHTLDHHTLFNLCAYILVFSLMYGYYQGNKESWEDRKLPANENNIMPRKS